MFLSDICAIDAKLAPIKLAAPQAYHLSIYPSRSSRWRYLLPPLFSHAMPSLPFVRMVLYKVTLPRYLFVYVYIFFLYTWDRAAPSSVDQFRRIEMLLGSRLVCV